MAKVRQCTGVNARGQRCGQRVRVDAAVPDDEVRCLVHRRGWPGRRCTGVNVRGDRCARMVQAAGDVPDDEVLCAYHRRVNKYVAPRRVKCTATRADGEPCEGWALKELVDSARPLCTYDAGLSIGRSLPPDDRRCTAVKRNGERCKRWALSDRGPTVDQEGAQQLCSMHAGLTGFQEGNELAWKHGYYAPPTPEEVAAKYTFMEGRLQYSVHGTIEPGSDKWWKLVAMCRLAIWGLLKNWEEGVVKKGLGVMHRHAERVFQGVRVIGKLVPRGQGFVRKKGEWRREERKGLMTEADFKEWEDSLPDEFWEEIEKEEGKRKKEEKKKED